MKGLDIWADEVTSLGLNWITLLIDQIDMPNYDELSHTFDELHEDVTSLCSNNEALKLNVSALSKEMRHYVTYLIFLISIQKNKKSSVVGLFVKKSYPRYFYYT